MDNHIRQTLDPVAPSHLLGLFDELHRACEQEGLLQAMRAVEHSRLIALEATCYFSSQSKHIHCPHCSCLRHNAGKTTHYHSAITPVILSPGHRQVVPRRPEFISPQDGQVKQDCEINPAKRWLAAHAGRHASGNDTLLGADPCAHQPFCRQVSLHGFHFLFTCKPASPTHLHGWVEGLQPGRQLHTLNLRLKGKSNRWEHHLYRWANGVPLTDSDDALKVNWCERTVTDSAGAVRHRNRFITDWKIENENNNVPKNRGHHLKHNFGHGKKHLSSLWLTMNLLAFGLHTLLELTDESYRLIRSKAGARRKFFQHLEALTTYLHFQTWERLMDFMLRGLEIGPSAIEKG